MLSGLRCPHVPTSLGFRRCRCSKASSFTRSTSDARCTERTQSLKAGWSLWLRTFCPVDTVGRKLFADLRVTATDTVWSSGEGKEVNGPIEGFVLAMSGRVAGLDELQGEGMALVHERAENL